MLKNLINSLRPYEREIFAAAALARDLAKTGCKQSEAANLKSADKLQSSAAEAQISMTRKILAAAKIPRTPRKRRRRKSKNARR